MKKYRLVEYDPNFKTVVRRVYVESWDSLMLACRNIQASPGNHLCIKEVEDIQTLDRNKEIDWEQRRYEIARDSMTAIMGRINYDPFTAVHNCCSCYDDKGENMNPYQGIAAMSVRAADALIAELKKEGAKKLLEHILKLLGGKIGLRVK